MLQPRLTNCIECSTIPVLLNDIDSKLNEIACNLYHDLVYLLNKPINGEVILDLTNYRRILTYKFCNPEYAAPFTVEQIASRVKLLKYK
jgi:hypothetical protein